MTSVGAARSALLALCAGSVMLAGCTSAEPEAAASLPTTAEPSGAVPSSADQGSPSPVASLPDPALLSEEPSLEAQQVATLLNSAGTGDAVLTLEDVSDRAHVVVRLVCAGPSDSHVLDASGRLLVGGSCDGPDGSSIDLLDAESENVGHVRVQASPTTRWRLYFGAY